VRVKSNANACGIPVDCTRNIPLWLVLLDNIPTVTMYLLGTVIIWPLGEWWGLAYLFDSALSDLF